MDIKALAQDAAPYVVERRHYYHQHPELTGEEKNTRDAIHRDLEALGITDIRDMVNCYGLVATIHGGKPGKTVALRADIDALPVKEETGLPFASHNEGKMHACGHDNHMAMLLGAAKLLQEHREELCGDVRLIFQPAEEMSPVGGSRGMLHSGYMDDVEAVFGLHVWPDLPHGKIGVKAGPLMAATDHFTINIHGKTAHGAKPNQGIDAVVLGSQFVMAAQTIVSRKVDPLDNAVVTFGIFNAGTRYNIIAGDCTLDGTVRTLNEDTRAMIEDSMRKTLDGLCLQSGATADINYGHGYPALVNHEEDAELIRNTAIKLFGKDDVVDVKLPAMPAEDFSFYLKEKKGAFVWLGTAKPEQDPVWPLHNSRFDVDEDILWRGSSLLAQTAIDYLNK